MDLTPKPGQRLERVKYYCDQRRKSFIRNALADDDFEIRRNLSDVVLMTRTDPETGHQQVLVKSMRGFLVGHGNGLSSSLPGLLFGKQYSRIRRKDVTKVWDFTREAWGIKAEDKQDSPEEQGASSMKLTELHLSKLQTVIDKIEERAALVADSDDEGFTPDSVANGQVDDAYYAGVDEGEIEFARELLAMLKD